MMHLEEEEEEKNDVKDIRENDSIKKVSSEMKLSKWKIVKESTNRISPEYSKGDIKLANLINELKKFSIEEENKRSQNISMGNPNSWITISRKYLSNLLSQTKFHYFIIILVILDLMVVLVDLILAQLSTPCLTEEEMIIYNTTIQRDSCLLPYSKGLYRGELFLFYLSLFLLIIFVSEVFLSFYALGWRHYKNFLYLTDGIIVFSSFVMEIYFHYGIIGRAGRAAAAIVVLRLWKIVRAIHAVAHSITLKNHLLIKKIQEAQLIIEEEKLNTEQMLEKQEIKLEYLINILIQLGKCPNSQQINKYVDTIWQQRKLNI